MKTLKWIVIILGILAAIFVVGGFLLPSGISIQRSVEINAPAEIAWGRAATLKTWPEWTVWNPKEDPTLKYTYSGPDTGKGSKMVWTAEKLGNGELEINDAVPGQKINYIMSMPEMGLSINGLLTFQADAGKTKVTWHDTGNMGSNLLYKWMGLMMDSMLGPAFDTNLKNLKTWSESQAKK